MCVTSVKIGQILKNREQTIENRTNFEIEFSFFVLDKFELKIPFDPLRLNIYFRSKKTNGTEKNSLFRKLHLICRLSSISISKTDDLYSTIKT